MVRSTSQFLKHSCRRRENNNTHISGFHVVFFYFLMQTSNGMAGVKRLKFSLPLVAFTCIYFHIKFNNTALFLITITYCSLLFFHKFFIKFKCLLQAAKKYGDDLIWILGQTVVGLCPKITSSKDVPLISGQQTASQSTPRTLSEAVGTPNPSTVKAKVIKVSLYINYTYRVSVRCHLLYREP